MHDNEQASKGSHFLKPENESVDTTETQKGRLWQVVALVIRWTRQMMYATCASETTAKNT